MRYGEVARAGSKGNYSVATFRQSTLQLQRAKFEIQVPSADAITLMDALQKQFSSSIINITQVYKEKDGVYRPTNEITILGSSLVYTDCSDVKNRVSNFASDKNLVFENVNQLEGDHPHSVIIRGLLDLDASKCGVVFMHTSDHKIIGDARDYSMPTGIGYTPGTGGALTLREYIEENNISVVKKFFANDEKSEEIRAKGYSEEKVIQGYQNASVIDKKIVKERLDCLNLDQNTYLAINNNRIYNKVMANSFNLFIERLIERFGTEDPVTCQKTCYELNKAVIAGQPRRNHAASVSSNLKTGTAARIIFDASES